MIPGLLSDNQARWWRAKSVVKKMQRPSVATLQHFFDIPYGTAANLADVLKERRKWPRCGSGKGGGGRTCFLDAGHRGGHAFECGK